MNHTSSDVGPFLHAVADPMRRKILVALKEKGGCSLGSDKAGLCAADIESRVKLAQPTVSHHMRILEKAGLVEVKKLGHWRWYRRNDKLIARLTRELKGQL
jgi:DNA-binding transcriptional ArsR family regulator